MKKFTTNDEIESLCEAMIKDFFKSRHYTNVLCVDIEGFVEEYLGIPIVYETFSTLLSTVTLSRTILPRISTPKEAFRRKKKKL